jgi:putative ABC transport system substrate-binding protein
MNRRDMIALLGGAAAWPVAARAQAVPVIGYLSGGSPGLMRDFVTAFHRGLNETGYTEGQNVAVEYLWAENDYDRLQALAAELVRRQVAVIFAAGTTPGALAAKAATGSIPIVFVVGTDPIKVGLVPSLARPGGNITGVTNFVVELIAKCMEAMHQLVSPETKVAVLLNPANGPQTESETKEVQAAARTLGMRVTILHASSPGEIERAFANVVAEKIEALVVSGELFFFTQGDLIIALAARHSVPTVFAYRESTEGGGLMSYGTSVTDVHRQGSVYVGRILKGERPADLPVQQPSKIALIINLRTAKTLGITVPLALLTRADEVIE